MDRRFVGDEFDIDVTLLDAGLDPGSTPTRRMIANASIGMGLDDASYSVRELRQALEWVLGGERLGRRKLTDLLSSPCDDYQRCLYYCLAGRGIGQAIADLTWLEELLAGRAKAGGKMLRSGVPLADALYPYVASEPDGPLGRFDVDFPLGEAWRRDVGQRGF